MLLYKVNCARRLLKPVRTDYHLTLFYLLYKDNLEFIFDFYQNLFYQNLFLSKWLLQQVKEIHLFILLRKFLQILKALLPFAENAVLPGCIDK